jgi:hypothetical protein
MPRSIVLSYLMHSSAKPDYVVVANTQIRIPKQDKDGYAVRTILPALNGGACRATGHDRFATIKSSTSPQH